MHIRTHTFWEVSAIVGEIEGTDEFVAWFEALDREDKVRVEEMIPVAGDLYRGHLDGLREEGLIR